MGRGKGTPNISPQIQCHSSPSDTHQSHHNPSVTLSGTPLPLERHPKLLGVTFDPHFTFHTHASVVKEQAAERLKLIKALAGSDWGQQKETIIMTYKALIWSKFSYAAPIWFPNLSEDAGQSLQIIQNAAMRIATGCHQRASSEHLHAETQLLPVVKSLEMVCARYLASALRPNHPSHAIVTQPSGPREKKHTLQSKFLPKISAYLTNNIVPIDQYEDIYKDIHTQAVQVAICTQPPTQPPTLETLLPQGPGR